MGEKKTQKIYLFIIKVQQVKINSKLRNLKSTFNTICFYSKIFRLLK